MATTHRNTVLGIILIGTLLATGAFAAAPDGSSGNWRPDWQAIQSSTAPALDSLPVTSLDGKAVDIAAKPGWKVVYFWSAECPCVTACENFTLRPLAAKYAGKVTFYAVAANGYDLSMSDAQLTAEAARHRLPYPVVLDRTHATAKALGAEVTPEVFLIGPDNRIVYSGMPDDSRRYLRLTGKQGITSSYLSRALDEALTHQPIRQPHSKLDGCIIAW